MSAATSSKIGSTIEKLPPRGSNHRGLDTEGVTSMPRELSKICAHCSGEFFKSPRKSLNHWKKRRFCSIDCANAGLRAERQAIPVMERISDRIDRSGDYKMSQVEQSEADAGRARDDNSWWVQRPEVDRLVAAAVEERDRQWREQLEGLADRIEDPSKWYGGRVPSLLTSPAEEIRAALGGSTE